MTAGGESWTWAVADGPILHTLAGTASHSLPGVTFPSLDKGLWLAVNDHYQSRTAQGLGVTS